MSEGIPPRPDGLWPSEVPSPTPPKPGARPPASWRWWEAIGVYLAGVILVGLVTLPILEAVHPASVARIAATIVTDLLLVGVLVIWLRRFHPGWRRAIGFPDRPLPEIAAGGIFGLLLYPAVAFGVGAILVVLLQGVSGDSVHAPQQLPGTLTGGRMVLAIVLALVVAPISEEFFFRGCLFRALRDRYGFWVGGLGSAVAFGLVHYVPSAWQNSVLLMSAMVFTGIGLAWVYERRGNLVASVAAHMAFNIFGLTLLLVAR